jgi:hypothetical protein
LEASVRTRVLVVAHRTAAGAPLIDKVRERAAKGPCDFSLLVPHAPRASDPEGEEAGRTLDQAVPLLEEAVGGAVTGMVGDSDPVIAVREALGGSRFDEVIISTLPARVSRWLAREVPRRVEEHGLPVTVVTAPEAEGSGSGEDAPRFGSARGA